MSAQSLVAAIDNFGSAANLQVRSVPRPEPREREIVVHVEAASVNPIDVRRRSGYGSRLFSLIGAARMPLVLGNDFVGTVCAVGKGVRAFREGDAVFGAKPPSSRGTHATHVVVQEEHALPRPSTISSSALAALPYNFLTVFRAFEGAGITGPRVKGRNVLVHGASGGLGLIAVWLVNSLGAHVTAVAGSRGLLACHAAGAAIALDHHSAPLKSLPRHFAATLNFANWNDEADLLRLLAPRAVGHATTVHPLLGNFDHSGLLRGGIATLYGKQRMRSLVPRGARYAWTVFRPDLSTLAILADIAPSLVRSEVKEFPLTKAAEAHLHIEQRRPGRAVIVPQWD